jgi:hypothetical protein
VLGLGVSGAGYVAASKGGWYRQLVPGQKYLLDLSSADQIHTCMLRYVCSSAKDTASRAEDYVQPTSRLTT